MKENRAAQLGITTLDDLARQAPRLTIGGDVEFFERPEWTAVQGVYDLNFARQRTFTSTFMYDALTGGEADVISAYTSDGRVAADRLRVIEDTRGAFPSYDAVLLIAPEAARDKRLVRALKPLIGAITVEDMREANFAVDRLEDKRSPTQAARELAKKIAP
jgi:osmoprotectant transport system permease protein